MINHKIFTRIFFVFVAMVLATGCTASPSLSVASGSSIPNSAQQPASPAFQTGTAGASGSQGITVVGNGTASGTPDMAQVNVGVETDAADVQKAVDNNQTKMTALLAALKAQGIDSKDIRTSNYSVYTQQQPLPAGAATQESATSVTYHVSNQVQVTLHDVTKLGSVLDKVIAAGANSIYGVTFGISNPGKLQDDARALAVQDAKSRADSIAKLEGLTLGNVISVSENTSIPGPVFAEAKGLGGGTPIQPGEQDVTVNLQVTYAIK